LNIENLVFIAPRSSSIIPHSKPCIPDVPVLNGLGVDGDGAHIPRTNTSWSLTLRGAPLAGLMPSLWKSRNS